MTDAKLQKNTFLYKKHLKYLAGSAKSGTFAAAKTEKIAALAQW